MEDKIREAIATEQVLNISTGDEETMTPEDVILIYIARKRGLTLEKNDIERIYNNLGERRINKFSDIFVDNLKNIFSRVLFNVLIHNNDSDNYYFTEDEDGYECINIFANKPEYIKTFTYLTNKYNLNNRMIHYIWYLLLIDTRSISDETIAAFDHQLNGTQPKSAKK